MPRFKPAIFTISDPGTTASASQKVNGGLYAYTMDLSAAAASTVIALQFSDDDTNWVAVNTPDGTACSTSANGVAADSFFNCSLTKGYVRIKASTGAGATTTGRAVVGPAKDQTDG